MTAALEQLEQETTPRRRVPRRRRLGWIKHQNPCRRRCLGQFSQATRWSLVPGSLKPFAASYPTATAPASTARASPRTLHRSMAQVFNSSLQPSPDAVRCTPVPPMAGRRVPSTINSLCYSFDPISSAKETWPAFKPFSFCSSYSTSILRKLISNSSRGKDRNLSGKSSPCSL